MTDDIFRIAIVVGVGLACVAFMVQAIVVVALFRRVGKLQARTEPLLERARPILDRIEPLVERITGLIEKAGPAVEKAGPAIEKAGPAIEKAGAAADRLRVVAERAEKVLASANRVIDEARPQVVSFSHEAVDIARIGREQVERVGELLHDAAAKAQERLGQIDHSVESTIEQVEQVSGAMRRAVLKPVREVNGLAAGISAAVSTLVGRSKKSSVDTAVQDEEMFI